MRLLLDESLPQRRRNHLPNHGQESAASAEPVCSSRVGRGAGCLVQRTARSGSARTRLGGGVDVSAGTHPGRCWSIAFHRVVLERTSQPTPHQSRVGVPGNAIDACFRMPQKDLRRACGHPEFTRSHRRLCYGPRFDPVVRLLSEKRPCTARKRDHHINATGTPADIPDIIPPVHPVQLTCCRPCCAPSAREPP